jgi:P27 family predicted phage terminase small subunit
VGYKPVGKRGPAPKPTRAKVLQGTFRKDRANPSEWKPPVGAPEMPAILEGEAADEWRRRVPPLVKAGIISENDGAAMAAYCLAWAQLVWAESEIKAVGGKRVFVTKSGYLQQLPQVGIANSAREQVVKYAREFGFTPSARTKVSATGGEQKSGDGWDDL